jgi:putative transposase
MSLATSEKVEVIRSVADSELSIRQILSELDISRSSFYRWYQDHLPGGPDALENRSRSPYRFWNKLPESVKEQCVEIALQYPERSPRELAWLITDEYKYFIFESSVYRVLKQHDLMTSPAYILLSASDSFHTQTKRINELWQRIIHLRVLRI